jgi:hypothetical protein
MMTMLLPPSDLLSLSVTHLGYPTYCKVILSGSILIAFCVGLDDDSGRFLVIGVAGFQRLLNRALG